MNSTMILLEAKVLRLCWPPCLICICRVPCDAGPRAAEEVAGPPDERRGTQQGHSPPRSGKLFLYTYGSIGHAQNLLTKGGPHVFLGYDCVPIRNTATTCACQSSDCPCAVMIKFAFLISVFYYACGQRPSQFRQLTRRFIVHVHAIWHCVHV